MAWTHLPSRQTLARGLAATSWVAFLAAAVVAWMVGVPRLRAYTAQQHISHEPPLRIEFVNPPRMPESIASSLQRTAALHVRRDPMGREDLVAVRTALLETGWFESIGQVRRTAEGAIQVHARFVYPFAVIRDQHGDHLVDPDARLLPMTYARGDQENYVIVTGAHFPRPQRPGQSWEGADVAAALRLVQLIAERPWCSQVSEIDVSQFLRKRLIRLRSDRGSTIVWGGAPGEEPVLELPAQAKIERLDFMHAHHGRIDLGVTGEVDISQPRGVFTREGT